MKPRKIAELQDCRIAERKGRKDERRDERKDEREDGRKVCNSCMRIQLNGEGYELGGPLTITELLRQLDIDPRRVAVEHNVVVLKRAVFDEVVIRDGDQVEIVNFVGGG